MNITVISPRRLLVETEAGTTTEKLLALDTGIPSGGLPAQRIGALASKGGVLVSSRGTVPWRISRIVSHGGRIFLCGPWLDGITVDEALERSGESPDSALIATVAQGLAVAVAPGGHVLCNTGTSLVTPDGSFLLLESSLAEEINRHLTLNERRNTVFPYRFTRLEGTATSVYQCGSLLGHIVTGSRLCSGDTQEDADRCHDRLRAAPGIHRLQPFLSSEMVELLESLITTPDAPASNSAETIREIARIAKSGPLLDEIDSAEAERRREVAAAAAGKSDRSWTRRQFMHHRGRTIAIAVLAALLIGSIPYQMIKSRLTPPSTAGMDPKSVVTVFYDAWQVLDHITMDETLARGVAGDLVREVTNVYVMDRVKMAYTMEGDIMPATEWIAAGRPDGKLPYGPVVAVSRILRQGEEEVLVQVDYELWRPVPTDEEGLIVTSSTVQDRLTLTPSRWGWEISAISTTILETTQSQTNRTDTTEGPM